MIVLRVDIHPPLPRMSYPHQVIDGKCTCMLSISNTCAEKDHSVDLHVLYPMRSGWREKSIWIT